MKKYDVYGLGNGLVDIFIEISEADFNSLGVERGTMRLVEAEEQQELLERFGSSDPVLVSGGSVANSMIALSQLGGRGAFACTLGDDKYGFHYKSEFDDLGIEIGNPIIVKGQTGTCVALITPDAERTMRTCLGIASHVSDRQIDEQTVAESKWIFVEGYLFSNPEFGQKAIDKAVELAKKHDTKIAVTFSEAWVIDAFGDALRKTVAQADLVFANEAEVKGFTGVDDFEKALATLGENIPNYAVTRGEQGAWVSFAGTQGHVDAFPCDPIDVTGAGDMFAGAFLYGITQGVNPLDSAKGACSLAREVIIRTGARLHSGVAEHWRDCLGA